MLGGNILNIVYPFCNWIDSVGDKDFKFTNVSSIIRANVLCGASFTLFTSCNNNKTF